MQGERRLVTVMFADISGFTPMAEKRDAEEMVTLVNSCLGRLSECVYRYDGTIDKYIGDAIMAVFGAPKAHEDDPERAVRAALDMQAALAEFRSNPPLPLTAPIDVHVGISTGDVIAGLIGAERRADYTVMGDTVNLASRLEDLSTPGQILVSEDTFRLTKQLFTFTDLGEMTIKGRLEPTRVYLVRGLRRRSTSMRGLTDLRYPLVGRQGEMRSLSLAVETLQHGEGGVVLVEGDAGIGKSRLVTEVRNQLQNSNNGHFQWLEGRGLSYGHSLNYHLLAHALRDYLGVTDEDDDVRVWPILQSATQQLLNSRAEDVVPYLAILLGLRLYGKVAERLPQTNPQLLQQRTFAAFGEWATAVAAEKPLVLAFDDMHWADPNSIALIRHLMNLCHHHSLLIVCVSRPDRESPYWHVRQQAIKEYSDALVHIQLSPLSENETLEFVHSLLALDALPPELEYIILSRAEGNPLFVEEILRAFIAQGALYEDAGIWRANWPIPGTELPETLQGMLTARIDRLGEPTKRAVQIAAVIGRVFLKSVLARVIEDETQLDNSLNQLVETGIIRERRQDRAQDTEYIFKHILTQEAAYQTLLAQQRKVYHRQVADALARLFWERGEALAGAGLVATHYERADAWYRAIRYLERAGDGVRAAFANKEAVDYYTRALQLADTWNVEEVEPLQRLGLHEKRGALLPTLGDIEGALNDYRRVLELAQVTQDQKAELRALNQIGSLLAGTQAMEQAGEYFNRALELARSIGDQEGMADSLNRLGESFRQSGDYRQAQQCHLQALEITHNLENKALLANSLEGLGQIDFLRGRLHTGIDKYNQVVDLRRRLVDQVGLMEALDALAEIYLWQGKYQQVLDVCLEGFDFLSRVGDLPNVVSLHTYFALGYMFLGDLEMVEDHLLAGLEVARRLDHMVMQSRSLSWLSYYKLEIGQIDDALEYAQAANKYAEASASPLYKARAQSRLGTVLLERGDAEAALEIFDQVCAAVRRIDSVPDRAMTLYNRGCANLKLGRLEALERISDELSQVAGRSQLGEYQVRGRWLRAQLLAARGENQAALGLLEDARALTEEQSASYLQWAIDVAIGDMHQVEGRRAEAQYVYAKAWKTIQKVASTLCTADAEKGLLESANVAQLRSKLEGAA